MQYMMKSLLLACGMLMSMLTAQPVLAACVLSVTDITSTTWRGQRGHGYDVFSERRMAQAVSFRIRSHGGGCQYFVTVAPVGATRGSAGLLRGPGSNSLEYMVGKDASGSQPLRPLGMASEAETYVSATEADGRAASFQFALALGPQQVVLPGQYTGELEISAYEGSLVNPILRDRRRVTVIVPVPAVAELSFSDGGAFNLRRSNVTVNFQKLRPGAQRMVQMRVRSNAGYRVSFRSANGALRHVDASDGSEVPYTVSVDGGQIQLRRGAPVQAIISNDVTGPDGRQYLIDITAGDIGNASAGDYIDTIDLTIFTLR